MINLDKNKTLGEIVTVFPGTVPILNKYKIDYCCGGKDTLNNAIVELNLNEESVLSELDSSITQSEESNDKAREWTSESMSNIIEFLLNTHHVFVKETLSEINDLMFTILKVHFKTDGEILLKVHSLFGQLKTELEAHLVKEEENLFPMILAFEKNKSPELKTEILRVINDTEKEHDIAGDLFKELEKLTNDFKAPAHACFTYNRTYELIDALEKDTFNHIHLENTILFGKI